MKRWAGLFFVLFILVSGCVQASERPDGKPNGQDNNNQSQAANEQEEVQLTYFSRYPEMEKTNQRLIDAFEEKNPHIQIELKSYAPLSYWSKISAMAAAGSAPDVFDMNSDFVDEWASKGFLYNLQDFVDNDINKEDYFTSVFDAVRYPDKETGDMYAFPYAWVTTVLYYNKDMFDEAGLEYPTKEWTWDEFLHAAQTLTLDTNNDGRTDQYGFWLYGRYAHIEPWIYQNDGLILNNEKTEFAMDDNAREAVKFLTNLTAEHKVSPKPMEMQGTNQSDIFPLGTAAMWVDGSWNIENNRNIINGQFDWGISTVPRGNNWKEDVAYGWPDNIAIFNETDHPQEAWEFIKFMTGKERTVENYTGGQVPVFKEAAISDEWLEKDKLPDNKSIILEQGELVVRNSFTRNWAEWRGYGTAEGSGMNGEVDQILDGKKTFDEAMDSLEKYANEVLEQAYQN
ncbi:ABC transporter substrate-binding protein [Aquibacillus albus]|uniref:Multiple sugar transport system substrate-binding protein n=1 Tax=Aquibacillus albus TaxID=1168171 RepID=A0ABS2N5U0_9BACI|nr:sugar ABC transporter substrate-binding protein [Aquibacillus albus]MBM7573478.1 multiple sugar transport system substrate-binding protein [Aquibacillus albus]